MRSIGDPDELEEERRLAYVGITRAEQRLHLSHAASRNLYGSNQYNPPSRFLDEIPAELVDEEESTASRRRSSSGGGQGRWNQSRDWKVDQAMSAGGRRESLGTGIADPTPAARATTGAHEIGLKVGDDVTHSSWGDGVIILIEGQGEKAEAVVRFPSVGEKRVLLSWTPLERVT
jgi:DNA helicase-2/ATP-dependent DNA helicase PcrA